MCLLVPRCRSLAPEFQNTATLEAKLLRNPPIEFFYIAAWTLPGYVLFIIKVPIGLFRSFGFSGHSDLLRIKKENTDPLAT